MNRQVKSIRIPRWPGREIVISDIHGNLKDYEKLLEKVDYQPKEDRLILLGDLVEKGPENLKTLRKIMKQAEDGEELVVLMGNCDFVAKNFLFSYRLDFIKEVLLNRKNSLIHEMIAEAGLPALDTETDMDDLAYSLRQKYLPELSFLNDLPQVAESPKRIYVHAGLLNEEDYAPDFRFVLTYPLFGETQQVFSKNVVAGHLPVTEYCRHKADFNPRYHSESHIYSIDGGNMVKKGGQLNALIFEDPITSTASVSSLPVVKAIRQTNPRNPAPFVISWNHGDLEILQENENQVQVLSNYLHRKFWIDRAFLHGNKGTDFTNYEMPLRYGDEVELVCLYGNKAQIKKQGILGWTLQENLDLHPVQG